MKLFQHRDFAAIVTATTQSLQESGLPRISEQIVEKDYYVTEARTEVYGYATALAGLPHIAASVLLEAGIMGVDSPTEARALTSHVADYAKSAGLTGFDDIVEFRMQVLHYRRTFVEKLFALHGKVTRAMADGASIGRDARHYYDVAMLVEDAAVQAMLGTAEYREFADDYRRIAESFFRFQAPLLPSDMRLRDSAALFPDRVSRATLAREYAEQCENLCFSEHYPSFDEVVGRFEAIRERL